jgi:pilus assembly protein CpaE
VVSAATDMTETSKNGESASESLSHVASLPRITLQAFCETDDLLRMIEAAAHDRRMARAHVKVHKGGVIAALEAYKSAPTPNLIILESCADRAVLVRQLGDLADYCDPGTRVVVIGYENDIDLYRDLTSRGVSDYIVGPVPVIDFIDRISALYKGSNAQTLGRSIAVLGAKGGVGASTIAQNLAWSISNKLEMETVIVDLDLPFGTVALNYNQDPTQGVAEAISSLDRLDAQYLDGLLSKCGDHLSILSAPVSLDKVYELDGEICDAVIEILTSIVPWSILDVPHSWNEWSKDVLSKIDDVVVVASPDLPNLRNARMMIDALSSLRPNDRAPNLVLNMVGVPRRPEISVEEFSQAVGLEALASIPFDPKFFGVATNNGQMLGEVDAASKIVEMIDDLGRVIVRREKHEKRQSGLFGKIFGSLVSRKSV